MELWGGSAAESGWMWCAGSVTARDRSNLGNMTARDRYALSASFPTFRCLYNRSACFLLFCRNYCRSSTFTNALQMRSIGAQRVCTAIRILYVPCSVKNDCQSSCVGHTLDPQKQCRLTAPTESSRRMSALKDQKCAARTKRWA